MFARFHFKQDKEKDPNACYQVAFDELNAGHKKSCWIWWIFPQLRSALPEPHSGTSEEYSLQDLKEAYNYLNDPVLFERYNTLANLVLTKLKDGIPIMTLMGKQIDVKKLVSSLTLFQEIAADLAKTSALAEYQGLSETCKEILEYLNAPQYPDYQRTLNALEAERLTFKKSNTNPDKNIQSAKSDNSLEMAFKMALITEIDNYIKQREKEPSYWYQGLFKGYSKKDKLQAAISLRLAVDSGGNNEIVTIAKAQGFDVAQLATRNCLDDLAILRQGRLGVCLRTFAKNNEFGRSVKTVRNLVAYIQEQRAIIVESENKI